MRFSVNQHIISLSLSALLTAMLILFSGQTHAKAHELQTCIAQAQTPLNIMECFRGLPYRVDGALDEQWRWTNWANQNNEYTSAGLNCSGLTTAISRSIWGQSISLDEAKHDRLNDSGINAPMGQDWDFGLDLILNLTEGLPRRLIPNPYEHQSLEDSHLWNALDLRGIDIDSSELPEMLAQLQPNNIYYFAISQSDTRFKGGISFYHVGLIIKDQTNIWLYHATPKGGVYRVNLAGEKATAWFRRHYGASSKGSKYIQLIEVELE